MTHLVKISEKNGQQLVNARELHHKLGAKKQFADWIRRRIEKYQFIENEDYFLISPIGEIKGRGGDRRSIEYHLTLTMAKELAMLQDNEMGRKIRRYFIEVEKAYRNNALPVYPDIFIEGVRCLHYVTWLMKNG